MWHANQHGRWGAAIHGPYDGGTVAQARDAPVPVDLTHAAVAAKEQSPDEKEQERWITDPAQRVLAAL